MIRRCDENDIDTVYALESDAFDDPMKKETMLCDLKRESYFCYGLFEEELVGMISYEKVLEEAQIITVAVKKRFWRQGFGKKLFEEVIGRAKSDGVEVFTLEVRRDNTRAIALYNSMGFETVGIRKNYYQNPVCDAILMDKKV